jgi:hypothetical protein
LISVVVAGIVRTVYLAKIESDDIDKTWNSFNLFVAGMAEGDLAIICASAPSLKSCFRNFFNDHFTTKGGTKGDTLGGYSVGITANAGRTWKESQRRQHRNDSSEKGLVLVDRSVSAEPDERDYDHFEIGKIPSSISHNRMRDGVSINQNSWFIDK